MSAAREEILERVGAALRDVGGGGQPDDEPPDDVRGYRREDARSQAELVELLCERVNDYAARAQRIPGEADVASAVTAACQAWGLSRLAVAPELPAAWRPEGLELVEDHGLSNAELDRLDGALTGCAAAIAETGTLVLDGRGACGRRALSLVVDHHICVVRAEQIHGGVPQALAAVAEAVSAHRAPITLISGPSATSDIELERVEGVHGPRHLLVLVVG